MSKTLVIQKTTHTHKYMLVKLFRKGTEHVYRCMLPGCNHYIPLSLIVGKISICWDCGDPFVINQRVLSARRKRPKCANCVKKSNRGNPTFRKDSEQPRRRHLDINSPTKLSRLTSQLVNALERDEDED